MAPKVGPGPLTLEQLVPDPFNPAAPLVQVTSENQRSGGDRREGVRADSVRTGSPAERVGGGWEIGIRCHSELSDIQNFGGGSGVPVGP
jgi:hypothetical protein